jgi:hypothetical protein
MPSTADLLHVDTAPRACAGRRAPQSSVQPDLSHNGASSRSDPDGACISAAAAAWMPILDPRTHLAFLALAATLSATRLFNSPRRTPPWSSVTFQ